MHTPIFITTKDDHSLETGLEPKFLMVAKMFRPRERSSKKTNKHKPYRIKLAPQACHDKLGE